MKEINGVVWLIGWVMDEPLGGIMEEGLSEKCNFNWGLENKKLPDEWQWELQQPHSKQ